MKDAIDHLMKDLRESFPDIVPSNDTEFDPLASGFDKPEDSTRKFLDREILVINSNTADKLIAEKGYIDVANSPYPTNAIKVIWNIAVRLKKCLESYSNFSGIKEFLELHLTYLDKGGSNLPQVVDKQTLKLAYCFRHFIDAFANNPDIFNSIPGILESLPVVKGYVKEVKTNGKKSAKQMADQLDQRIAYYEARQPTNYQRQVADTDLCVKKYSELMVLMDKCIRQNEEPDLLIHSITESRIDEAIADIKALIIKIEKLSPLIVNTMYVPRTNLSDTSEEMFLNGELSTTNVFYSNPDGKTQLLDSLSQYQKALLEMKPKFAQLRQSFESYTENHLTKMIQKCIDKFPSELNEENKNEAESSLRYVERELAHLRKTYKGFHTNAFHPLEVAIDKQTEKLRNFGLSEIDVLKRKKIENNKRQYQLINQKISLSEKRSRLAFSLKTFQKNAILCLNTMEKAEQETQEILREHQNAIERLKKKISDYDVEMRQYYGFNLTNFYEYFRHAQLGTNFYISLYEALKEHEDKAQELQSIPDRMTPKKAEFAKAEKEMQALLALHDSTIEEVSNEIDALAKESKAIDQQLTTLYAGNHAKEKPADNASASISMRNAQAAKAEVRGAPSPQPQPKMNSGKSAREKLYNDAVEQIDGYLKQRANTYYAEDKLRKAAEILFSCVGYRSDATRRKKHLRKIKTALLNYKENGHSEALLKLLDADIARFKPRADTGKEYAQSMRFLLSSLRDQIQRAEGDQSLVGQYHPK